MNRQNVLALTAIVAEYVRDDPKDDWDIGDLAVWLASHGVLVPSVITDEDVKNGHEFGAHEEGYSDSGTWYELRRDDTVDALERIAKGEQAS